MPRSNKFLIFILILLVINVLFFGFWYSFGGRNWVRNYLARLAGRMIGAEIQVEDLHISDKQIYLQGFSLSLPDSLLDLEVESISIRYNLYELLANKFKPDGAISSIEILRPNAILRYVDTPKDKKYKPKRRWTYELPDLRKYFKTAQLIDGSIFADLAFPLKIQNDDYLYIEEGLRKINLKLDNDQASHISLTAISSRGGSLAIEGTLNAGQIEQAQAELANYKPQYIAHQDIQGFGSEINLNLSYSGTLDIEQADYSAQAIIWNTQATLLNEYPLKVPFISASLDGANLKTEISSSRLGSSTFNANINLQNLGKEPSFDGSSLNANLDLRMILPELSGRVQAQAQASGTFREPYLALQANSAKAAYDIWEIEDIKLKASYEKDIAYLELDHGIYENQALKLNASFDPYLMALKAELDTEPLGAENPLYTAKGRLELESLLLKPYPMLSLNISHLDLGYQDALIQNINGNLEMVPLEDALLISADIYAKDELTLSLAGDILGQQYVLDLGFKDQKPGDYYPKIRNLESTIAGTISLNMYKDKVWTRTGLKLKATGDYPLEGDFDLLGSVNTKDLSGSLFLQSYNAAFNNETFKLDLAAQYQNEELSLHGLRLGNLLSLSGKINPKDWQNMVFDLALKGLNNQIITAYYPSLALYLPDFQDFSLFAKYNQAGDRLFNGRLNLQDIDLISIIPIDLELTLSGVPEAIEVLGDINSQGSRLISLAGEMELLPTLNLAVQADFGEIEVQKLLTQPPLDATVAGSVSAELKRLNSKAPSLEFAADLQAKEIHIEDFELDYVRLKAAQLSEALIIDSLQVSASDMFELSAKGSLGYNLISQEYFDAGHSLALSLEGQLFPWLKELTDYILESRGESNLNLTLGNDDESFIVYSGELDIHSGFLHLKDQVEPLRNIEIKGLFDNNRFILSRGQFSMGNGKFYMNNVFDAEPSDHFQIAFLDLGYLRLMIEKPGIQASIPLVAPPKTISNIALKGQKSRYATLRGPFEDMKIEADITASNLDILFPPGADNLVNLILSVRNTGKKPDSDPIPLPFQMDIFVNIGENVRYVTYPTNLSLKPGGFLHLLYDGNNFIVKEVFITSDRGTVDFLGTVFQVDNINISMIDQQDIINVEGLFSKRTPDGSTVSLSVHSTPEFDKSLLDRLQISLFSDNPQDRNISQVLSRMRYNQNMDELPDEQKQNLLQDEALGLIGENLNASVLNPIFYPVENWLRRSLGLDSFSINAGFIQNLFTEYSSDPSQLAELTDINNIASDISRFSSAILLNNLSISMSKYLGYRFFIDYSFGLQEATDLQKKTKIMVSHDTSLRLVLPKDYRMGYTFRYEPSAAGITHEIMLQKMLRFWGL